MQLVLQIQSGYFFEEMYLPLIKSLPKETEVVVLLDMDKSDRYIKIIEDLCLSVPKVLKVLVRPINSSNKWKNLSNLRELLRQMNDGGFFLACDLSTPEMRFLKHELSKRHIKHALLQSSGLHHSFWMKYSSKISVEEHASSTEWLLRRLCNYSRYPRYMSYVIRYIHRFYKDLWFRYVFSSLLQGETYPKTEFDAFPYISDKNDKIISIYGPDVQLLNMAFGVKTAILAKPPYFSVGNKSRERDFLISFPGPLHDKAQRDSLGPFFEVTKQVLKLQKFRQVLVRFHPRETAKSEAAILDLFQNQFDGLEFKDVSRKPIWPVLATTKTLVSGISNVLALGRLSSRTRQVIAVMDTGLTGVMGSNVQYHGIPGIAWVKTADKIDWDVLTGPVFEQLTEPRPTIARLLECMCNDTPEVMVSEPY